MRHFAAMIVGLGMSICFASSQEPKKDDPHTVIVWLAVVVPQNGRPEHELGEYATFEAAKAATDKWEEANKNNKAEATTLVTQREVKVRRMPPTPGAKAEVPELPSAGGKPGGGTDNGKKTIIVSVYKQAEGKWVKQPDLQFVTDSEYDKASKYYQKVRFMSGWNATWNAPGWPKPKIAAPELKVVDPVR